MMKWKVVRSPRCVSADRSLECLKNNKHFASDSNNNDQVKEDPSTHKTNGKQQDLNLIRKPSLTSDCLNFKSFLGLSRQRSENNLSNLGNLGNINLSNLSNNFGNLVNKEQRRSRSEVRGVSCDRLTVGYHSGVLDNKPPTPSTPSQNQKAGGWLRGRKKERDTRSPSKSTKISHDAAGNTVVAGTGHKQVKADARTVADQSGTTKVAIPKPPREGHKSKGYQKHLSENVAEEEIIYAEIERINTPVKDKKVVVKREAPKKGPRKKGIAPTPEVAIARAKAVNGNVNLNPNGSESSTCFVEKSKSSPYISTSKKIQPQNGRVPDKEVENKTINSEKNNNLKNTHNHFNLKNRSHSNYNPIVAIAEIHQNHINKQVHAEDFFKNDENFKDSNMRNKMCNGISEKLCDKLTKHDPMNTNFARRINFDAYEKTENHTDNKINGEKDQIKEETEALAYHIDTPDYSTLESDIQNDSKSNSPEMSTLKNNFGNSDIVMSTSNKNHSFKTFSPADLSEHEKYNDGLISSILRDTSNDKALETEHFTRKVVRFEKFDLIDTYKKSKLDNVSNKNDECHAPILRKNSVKLNLTDDAEDEISECCSVESPRENRSNLPSPNNIHNKTENIITKAELKDSPDNAIPETHPIPDSDNTTLEGSPTQPIPANNTVSTSINPQTKELEININKVPPTSSVQESANFPSSVALTKLMSSSSECLSEYSVSSSDGPPNGMTVNVLVRNNASPECQLTGCIVDSQTEDPQTHLVVKKSFVLTIAKQERGFQSLCANKKPDLSPAKKDHKISVTFMCSSGNSESWLGGTSLSAVRLRSVSVPPQCQQETEILAAMPPIRGRSRERRSRDRQQHRKNHKSRKKDVSVHMPQAVIDELSQVLEKRKPT